MRLNTVTYYADFFLSLGIVLFLLARMMLVGGPLEMLEWFASAAAGFMAWTLAEYLIHRWLYHHVRFFSEMHAKHHDEPNMMIGAPPIIGLALIYIIVYAPTVPISLLIASGLTSGALLGYMAYQLVHHASHFWQPAAGSYLYRMRLHHSLHHYRDEQGNYGITTSFWDVVFGTALQPQRQWFKI